MNRRTRAAVAGAAATVWGLLEPFDQRLGFVVHATNGAVFGLVFAAVRERVDVDPRRLALALALGENVALWPLLAFVDRTLVTSPRAFAQSTLRHAVFGWLLGRLAYE